MTVWIKYWQDKHGNYITVPRLQRELTLACYNALPTAVLERCYKKFHMSWDVPLWTRSYWNYSSCPTLLYLLYLTNIIFLNVKLLLSNQYVVVSLNVVSLNFVIQSTKLVRLCLPTDNSTMNHNILSCLFSIIVIFSVVFIMLICDCN